MGATNTTNYLYAMGTRSTSDWVWRGQFNEILTPILGFTFSEAEPSALVQLQGGPCGVIAPVQAFLLKFLLAETTTTNWKNVCCCH